MEDGSVHPDGNVSSGTHQHNSCCYATMQHLMTSFCMDQHDLADLHLLNKFSNLSFYFLICSDTCKNSL